MNKYGLPLTTPSVQTILPAMTMDGRVIGWYPISQTTFAGTETTFTLTDTGNGGSGTVVPLSTVTTDSGNGVPQYMAAVWPVGLAADYHPWASTLLQAPDSGYSRWYSMPTEGWITHFSPGVYFDSMTTRLNITAVVPSTPSAPSVSNAALTWKASVKYAQLTGDCPFFDFNWMTLFASSSPTSDPLRITVVSQPSGTPPPLKAAVIGQPIATSNGVVYNTIRIMKLGDDVPTGTYTFTFAVLDTLGQSTSVTLTLTVA